MWDQMTRCEIHETKIQFFFYLLPPSLVQVELVVEMTTNYTVFPYVEGELPVGEELATAVEGLEELVGGCGEECSAAYIHTEL